MPRKRKSDLSRNTRSAKLQKLAKKKRALEEANRQVIIMVAGTPGSSQLSGEYHAGYLAAQTATETSELTRQKLQEQLDDQEIIKADEMIEVKNASRIENVRTMELQGQSFSSRNICDTKNVSGYDLAIDNGSHGLVTRGLVNNQSRFCKVMKPKEDTPRIFCSKGIPTISAPEMIPFGIHQALPYFPPYHYPMPFPIPPVFSPSNFPFPVPFLKNIHTSENLKPSINECKYNSMENKEDAPKPKLTVANSSSDDTNSAAIIMPGKFKKPKNIHEYKELIEAARKNPREFPEILVSKKNQFLSSLGIAPKIICSIRTLKKFRKQFKRKQFMTRDCMIYRDRKMLRDRNKLKKCFNQKKQHNYLGLTFPKKSSLLRHEAENSMNKESQSSKTLKLLVGEQEDAGSSMKSIKLSDIEKNKTIELITIVSSDEESAEKHPFLPTEDETQEEDVKTNKRSNSILRDVKDQHLETITEQSCDIDTDVENSNKNDSPKKQNGIEIKCSKNLDDSHKNLEKEVKYKDCGNETNKNKPTISQKLRNAILKENIRLENIRLLQSENHVNYPLSNLSSGSSTIPKEIHFSVPQFAILQPTQAITMAANSISYLPSQLNSTPVVVRSVTPLALQPPATVAASGQNNNVNIVYPVKLTKATSSKVVLIDKQQNGAYFIAPSYNKSLLSQNNIRIQPQRIFNSKVSSIESSMFTPQLHQLKPKPRKNKTMVNQGNSSKTDINEEMNRIAAWVYRMKSILNPCMLRNGEEKSVQKLLSQLDIGIYLVRKAKKSLKEIEHIMDSSESSMEIEQ